MKRDHIVASVALHLYAYLFVLTCAASLSFAEVAVEMVAARPAGYMEILPELIDGLPPWPPNQDDSQIPLDWWNVVILVNADSPVSIETARMYRRVHPQIIDEQVVYLSGLPDSASPSATPADEIITRAQFETLIAQPTREHLASHDLLNITYVLLTTAGMPYRIEDTDPGLADVVKPAASNGQLTVANRYRVDAAAVESELSCLFLLDPAGDNAWRMPIQNRIVNPYHGYGCSIKRWAFERDLLVRREMFRWTYIWRVARSPKIEGHFDPKGYSACDRHMSPADLYLVMRLDGPHATGEYPIFAVWEMLHRAARVSDAQHRRFVGYDPRRSEVVIDHSPRPPAPDVFASTSIYNFPSRYAMLTYEDAPTPPGAEAYISEINSGNHYFRTFEYLTGFPATEGGTGSRTISAGLGGIALWDDSGTILNNSFVASDAGIVGLQTYGRNGGDGRPVDYLLRGGPGNGPLFRCVPGAVFSSLESFNAVTMFRDAPINQAKIVDFIDMGGTAAVGHVFEPEVSATIQGEFLFRNLLRDDDSDGIGDLCLAEAVYSAMPFLSWSEVALGDPLMRLRWGPGAVVDLTPRTGDVNDDGAVGWGDVLGVLAAYDSVVGDGTYHVPADVNRDGQIDGDDLAILAQMYGTIYPDS